MKNEKIKEITSKAIEQLVAVQEHPCGKRSLTRGGLLPVVAIIDAEWTHSRKTGTTIGVPEWLAFARGWRRAPAPSAVEA